MKFRAIIFCLAGSFLLTCCSSQEIGAAPTLPQETIPVSTAVPNPTENAGTRKAGQAATTTSAATQSITPEPPGIGATPSADAIPTGNTPSAPVVSATPGITPLGPTPPHPREWSGWPIVPYVSARAIQVYREGISRGNQPGVFSVIGDCQSVPGVFLGIYSTDRYALPEDYAYLQETIDAFEGSFAGVRPAVRDGLRASSALSPLWADPAFCLPEETPLECDLRVNRPSIVFVNLGTNLAPDETPGIYEFYLRQIVEIILANGSLPILSTKADNIEGDYSVNAATVRVAYEYEIPLWNFWRAADHLPGHGLDEDGIYLTPDGWDVRSFSGLQVLDWVWRAVRLP